VVTAVHPPFVFIVGRGRSGTTLLRAQLDSHPAIAVAQESHFLAALCDRRRRYETAGGLAVGAFVRDLSAHRSFFRLGMPAEEISAMLSDPLPGSVSDAIRRIYASYASRRGKPRYGDKTPNNVVHIELLAGLFPEARFVHVIRDGRDATLSYLDVDFGPSTVAESAVYWRRFVEDGRRAGEVIGPHRYREVRYESLVVEPVRELRILCEFLELPYDDAMLRYPDRAAELVGKVHHNLALPPTSGMRDWRRDMSREDIALFEALAGGLLDELGYERAFPRTTVSDRIRARRAWLGIQAARVARRTSSGRNGAVGATVPPKERRP
jgi:hypothetical protein